MRDLWINDGQTITTPGSTAVLLPFFAAILAAACYIYTNAISARDPSKWDKQPDEPDAMGAIMGSMLRR